MLFRREMVQIEEAHTYNALMHNSLNSSAAIEFCFSM